MKKDLIIIGGGPGGYVAAIRAAQLGRNVTLIEGDNVGGTCLNHGCIPTKALYRSAEVIDEMRRAAEFGVKSEGAVEPDVPAIRERTGNVVNTLVGGVASLLKGNGVEVIKGMATFTGANTLEVNGEELTFDQVIIATGSLPSALPIPGIDSEGVMDSTQALALDEIPKRLLVIGGGVIGIEMAGIYQTFGSEVTVVEFMPTILPMIDLEAARYANKELKKRGIDIHTSAKVQKIEKQGEELLVTVEEKDGEKVYTCDRVLACVGRAANINGLGLDAAGVTYDRKGIKVDENYETNVKGIFAIGDVTGRIMLAHVASDEGKVCVERMAGKKVSVNYDLVPNCIFTFPEIASIGKTEGQLKEAGTAFTSGKFTFAGNGKALTLGENVGFIKILAGENDEILGVHIIGPHASDLIHTAIMGMHAELTVAELASAMYAHPTLAEALDEAAMAVHGEAIHAAPRRKK